MARKITDYIIIHCADTKPSMNTDIRDVDRWHREQGWRMVGYHFFIKRDGTLQTGRHLHDAGAHAKGYNEKSIGVCLAGGKSEDGKRAEANYTDAQWQRLEEAVKELHQLFPGAAIIGHRDVDPKKACPCFDVKEWWAKARAK